ncbi:nucleoside hydrolase [Catellatospora sp. TT07R-123]|uniref:nucleoside hydrolase n=1 Tax=Catellatospora sp. TT07R-123 TaxID=2733863 RepID=UPI001BB35EC3|nr:nucleoside hydrolase [Catellatospora sp. TT07R-123]
MLDVVWDMETGDPDDFLTLLLLAGHPEVNLRAVTVTPGSPAQIGVVRHGLALLGRTDVRIGAYNLAHPKACVSPWHYRVLGEVAPSSDAEPGGQVLAEVCDEQTTLVCGAPLKNLGAAIAGGRLRLGTLVAQGGFAGEGVVPASRQLPKFRGLATCPTYNLNGDRRAALAALAYPGIRERWFVSKNVCHGVVYDQDLHEHVGAVAHRNPALGLIHRMMGDYLAHHPDGKKFHDPLAACCAIDRGVGTWAQVEIYRAGNEWGARPATGTHTSIITGYDPQRFLDILTSSRRA